MIIVMITMLLMSIMNMRGIETQDQEEYEIAHKGDSDGVDDDDDIHDYDDHHDDDAPHDD